MDTQVHQKLSGSANMSAGKRSHAPSEIKAPKGCTASTLPETTKPLVMSSVNLPWATH